LRSCSSTRSLVVSISPWRLLVHAPRDISKSRLVSPMFTSKPDRSSGLTREEEQARALRSHQSSTGPHHDQWQCSSASSRPYKSTTAGRPDAALQCLPSDLLCGVPKRATQEENLEAMEDRFGDYHPAGAYLSWKRESL
jgi:hypothetical protein